MESNAGLLARELNLASSPGFDVCRVDRLFLGRCNTHGSTHPRNAACDRLYQ